MLALQCCTLPLVSHYTAAQSAPFESVQVQFPRRRQMRFKATQNSFFLCFKVTKAPCELIAQCAQFVSKVPIWERCCADLVQQYLATGKVRQGAFVSPIKAASLEMPSLRRTSVIMRSRPWSWRFNTLR